MAPQCLSAEVCGPLGRVSLLLGVATQSSCVGAPPAALLPPFSLTQASPIQRGENSGFQSHKPSNDGLVQP